MKSMTISILLSTMVLCVNQAWPQAPTPEEQRAASVVTDLQVVDSSPRRHTLGQAIISFQNPTAPETAVALQVDDQLVLINISPYGSHDGPAGYYTFFNIVFASPDCSDQPLIPWKFEGHSFFTPAAITGPGNTVWVPSVPIEQYFFSVVLSSWAQNEGDPLGVPRCYPQGGYGSYVAPAKAVLQLNDLFTPPFTLANVSHVNRQTKGRTTGPASVTPNQ